MDKVYFFTNGVNIKIGYTKLNIEIIKSVYLNTTSKPILHIIEIQFIKTVSPIHFFELSQIDSNLLLNITCLHSYRLHFCKYYDFC